MVTSSAPRHWQYATPPPPPPHPPPRTLIGLRSTAGLMAGIVYGGDIQSIGTDH